MLALSVLSVPLTIIQLTLISTLRNIFFPSFPSCLSSYAPSYNMTQHTKQFKEYTHLHTHN